MLVNCGQLELAELGLQSVGLKWRPAKPTAACPEPAAAGAKSAVARWVKGEG